MDTPINDTEILMAVAPAKPIRLTMINGKRLRIIADRIVSWSEVDDHVIVNYTEGSGQIMTQPVSNTIEEIDEQYSKAWD